MSAGGSRWSRPAASSASIRPGNITRARAGFAWERGDLAAPADLDAVAEGMADTLVAALTARPLPHDVAHLYLTDPILDFGAIDGVMFSGGVGEYVYGREDRDFGDLGRRLGRAIRRRIDAGALPWPLLPAGECIRATALGASEYSVQLSGNTSYISSPGALLAAAQSAGAAARLRGGRRHRSRCAGGGDPRPSRRLRRRRRPRGRARAALAGGAGL